MELGNPPDDLIYFYGHLVGCAVSCRSPASLASCSWGSTKSTSAHTDVLCCDILHYFVVAYIDHRVRYSQPSISIQNHGSRIHREPKVATRLAYTRVQCGCQGIMY